MTHTIDENADGQPDYTLDYMLDTDAVPTGVRTVLYIVGVVVNAAVLLYFGAAAIWGWLPGEQAARTEALMLGVLGMLVSGLGVAYRPTRTLDA